MKNLYEILGVNEEATSSDIKRAYVKLALENHPDKGGSEESMKLLNLAYGTLSDAKLRSKYDTDYFAYKVADVETKENMVITDFLPTGKTPPYSLTFRRKHQQLTAEFEQEPLINLDKKTTTYTSDIYQFVDQDGKVIYFNNIYAFIHRKEKDLQPKELLFKPVKLTLIVALDLINNFLLGNYYGTQLIAIRKYLFAEISDLQQEQPQSPILPLYEGIFELCIMVDKDFSEHASLLFSIKKIVEYAKQATQSELLSIIPLFYNKFFRNLHAYALHMHWDSKNTLFETEHLATFDGTEAAKRLLENFRNRLSENNDSDNLLILISYIKLLYQFEKDRNDASALEKTANDYRNNAFHFLDWLPAFRTTSRKAIIANVFLQIGIKFQQASRLESNPAAKMADEQLAITMYLTATELAKLETPNIEIYININVLKYLSALQYHEPTLIEIIKAIKKSTLLLTDCFPFFESHQSNIDLFNDGRAMLNLMRKLLSRMVDIHEHNKSHTQAIDIDQSSVTILYRAYEACLKNWYQEKYNPELEQQFRIELMDELLFNQGWLFLDVEQNLDSAFIMVDRDEQGWMRPTRALPFGDEANIQTYKSINGLEINNETGEINFFLTPWTNNLPVSDKVFTQFDLQEMLEKNIGGAIFSLDPVDPEKPYHPFNLMRFSPPELDESELLNTMLLTDYILKFLTTTQEVQGLYPFNQKPVSSLIGHLPEYLRKIVTDFQEAPHSGEIHRFWIEAEEITVPTTEQNNGNFIRIGVNDLKMVVKKHRMIRDIHGELQDVGNEDEGWPIYVLTNEQIDELKQGKRIIQGSAMIFTHAETKLMYWEHHEEIHFHVPKDFRETLIRLYLQPREADGQILFNTKNMPLIYRITKEMAKQSGLPHRYSAEFIFAHEFTVHYNEFAQYLPEFGRLKELSKIAVLVSFLKNLRHQNQKTLKVLDFLINTPLSSPAPKNEIYQSYKKVQEQLGKQIPIQFSEWRKNFAASMVEKKCYEEIQRIKTAIGPLSFNAHSAEVKTNCEAWYKQLARDNPGIASYRLWDEVINPKKTEIARNLTEQAQKNAKKVLRDLFAKHAFPSFDSAINAFINGDIQPLADALTAHEKNDIKKLLLKQFPGSSAQDLMAALEGSTTAIDKIVRQEAMNYYKKEKASCDVIEKGYADIRLGKQNEPVNLEGKCFWVPASVCHQEPLSTSRHSFFVYGGVNINPRVNVVQGNGALRGNQVNGGTFNRADITKGFQSHHIVSPTNAATKNHELLTLAGFNNRRDMNSQVNRILLPVNREQHPVRSLHNGRHTQMAMDAVASQMTTIVNRGQAQNWSQAQYRSELRTIISQNRQALRTGLTDLYVKPTVPTKRG